MEHRIIHADVFDGLRQLPEKSVHCFGTSIPYWKLRQYLDEDDPLKKFEIGQEPTPDEYVRTIVRVFREVWRVLRDDGIGFLNIADCYAEHPTINLKPKDMCLIPFKLAIALQEDGWWIRKDIIWAKGLSFCQEYAGNCMPEPVTDRPASAHEYIFLMTKSGNPQYWTHRDKDGTRTQPDPDFRYINLMTGKEFIEQPENYDPKKEIPCPACGGKGKVKAPWFDAMVKCETCDGEGKIKLWSKINLWQGHDYFYDHEAVKEPYASTDDFESRANRDHPRNEGHPRADLGGDRSRFYSNGGRNLRDVWAIGTKPYLDAHFATFPPDLCIPMILAGTSAHGCCPSCGAPWERVVEKDDLDIEAKRKCGADKKGEYNGQSEKWLKQDALGKQTYTGFNDRCRRKKQQNASDVKRHILNGMKKTTAVRWRPTCDCGIREVVPCTTLDPFGGSGTVMEMSRELGRSCVIIELNGKSIELIKKRLGIQNQCVLDTGVVDYRIESVKATGVN